LKKLFAISPVEGFTVNVLIEPIADESLDATAYQSDESWIM